MGLTELAPSYLSAIEQTLRDALGYQHDQPLDAGYLQMLYYHMGWDHVGQVPTVAGKRTRPLLTLLCTAAAGGDPRLALPFAVSIELIHNFSLIQDDIQDNSPLRRGRPTVWAIWGQAQAINAGDALFTHAHQVVEQATGLPAEMRLMALTLLDEACIALTKGQYLDLEFESRDVVSIQEYMTMVAGKTATLIATAAELGALAAEASDDVRQHCRAFGHDLGLAFQIHDDVLGIWGNATMTGKSAATDIEQRKKTLPLIYGLEHSSELRDAYQTSGNGGADVGTIRAMLEAKGAREYVEAEECRQADQAMQHLGAARPIGEAGDALRELTLQLLGRTN